MTNYESFATKSIRIGSDPDPINGSVIPGIFQTSTFVQKSPGQHLGFDYTRCTNPTRKSLEDCLASLENSKHCVAVGSGLAAITAVFNLLKKGANIICGNDVYGGTYRLLSTIFEDRYNVKWVDTTDIANVKKACEEFGKVDLIWVEALSNPLLRITDIKAIAEISKKYGSLLAVDSTFLTPYFQRPLELGADLVVHSLTKYINGHSDVIAGAVFTDSKELYDKLFYVQKTLGPSLSPFDSWLILRGVKTLEVRIRQHQENAITIANHLKAHKKIARVLYPGLDNHKNCEILKSQTTKEFKGGAMISIYIKGGIDNSKKFLESLEIFQLAESLGGVESLACLPALMTHASVPEKIRNENGITDSLIRLSVGIEGVEDLLKDLDKALLAI
jgi:cystathionine gamma-lyase